MGLHFWLSWYIIHLQYRRPGFDPWVGKILWKRERLPTPVFWSGEFHGLSRPWGCKELDMTEQLSLNDICFRVQFVKMLVCKAFEFSFISE